MDFFSPELVKIRFKKTNWTQLNDLSLDASMLRALLVIDENKTVSQINNELGSNLSRLRDALYELWRLELIIPINGEKSCQCHELIEKIIRHRSGGNPAIAKALKAKLHLKGIDPNRFSPGSPDDPAVLGKLISLARKLGIPVTENKSPSQAKLSRGKTRLIIDNIVTQRSRGNPEVARTLRTKLALKGINPHDHSYDTLDDPIILGKVLSLAHKMGITVEMHTSSEKTAASSKGQICRLIHAIIQKRARGNPVIEKAMKTKFILKGINPDDYTPETVDNPVVLKKLAALAKSSGIDPGIQGRAGTKTSRGRIKYILEKIIEQKSNGNDETAKLIKEKFIRKGLDPDKFSDHTEDEPKLMEKLETLARNLHVTI